MFFLRALKINSKAKMFKNLNIVQIIAKIIFFALGLLCLYWSFKFITANASFVDDLKIVTEKYDSSDEGKMIIAKGNLHNDSTITDPKMNVTAEGVSEMKRIVEMLQYQKKDEESYSIDWFAYQCSSFAIETDEGNKRFINPKFPQDLQCINFYGKAILGDTGLSLSDRHFIYLNLNNTDREKKIIKWVNYTDLPEDGGKQYGLTLSDGYYKSSSNGKDSIGDIRVSYQIQTIKNKPFITAIGIQNNGTLDQYAYNTDHNVGHAFYGDLNKEEIKKAIKGNNMTAFVTAFIFGLIFILVGILCFNCDKVYIPTLKSQKSIFK